MFEPCDCGSGATYLACCGRLHAGTPANTAEQLMRSRYSAFRRGDVAYLLKSRAAETRPLSLSLDPGQEWTGLPKSAASASTEPKFCNLFKTLEDSVSTFCFLIDLGILEELLLASLRFVHSLTMNPSFQLQMLSHFLTKTFYLYPLAFPRS